MFFKSIFSGMRIPIIGLLGLAGIAVAVMIAVIVMDVQDIRIIILAGGFIAIGAIAIAGELVRLHFKRLQDLQNAVIATMSESAESVVYRASKNSQDEVAKFHQRIDALVRDRLANKQEINIRLEAVLANIAEAVLVVTDSGLVSLVNAGAKSLLGERQVAAGTSIFAALEIETWERAADKARASKTPIEADLKTLNGKILKARIAELADHGGLTVVFAAETISGVFDIEHRLDLHDLPPSPVKFERDTQLATLPALVLDCETTGLDVTKDAVISVGAVRTYGGRIYHAAVIDEIVNPGQSISKASTAIHGITNDMARNAGGFDTIWPQLSALLDGVVLVGYNIGFDIAFLQKATRHANIMWPEPVFLDVMLLYAALEPDAEEMSLDSVADSLGIEIEGRHTALGDALATAEVFTRLLPRLKAAGVTVLQEALDFQKRPKHIIALQEKAGWQGIKT